VQEISSPVVTLWSVVPRFDNLQAYKYFVKNCNVVGRNGDVGTLHKVNVISGLSAACSTECLEILDEEHHIISFSIVGGDHCLTNYRLVTTLHPSPVGNDTVVIESYVVDVPPEKTREDTSMFVNNIVQCTLQSLAQIAELEKSLQRDLMMSRRFLRAWIGFQEGSNKLGAYNRYFRSKKSCV
jgi:abscisic acid receptor (PYR/PYL family)